MNQSLTLNIIDLIEDSLPNLVALDDLAEQCGYSRSYIQHQFKAETGFSISYYQRARNLSLAALRLAEGQQRVLDVAIEFGFESQEAFARAFRQFGATQPSRLLGQGTWAQRLHLERLDAEMLAQLKHCQTLPIRVSEQQASRWGCYVFTVDTCKRDVSVVIQSITDAFERLQREACGKTLNYAQAQLLEFREHNQNATSTYPMSIAFPFTSDETIPEPLLEIQLSAYRLAEISLPSPNYIPIIFHHFYQRIFDEQQSYFGGLPAFWRFDETTGQLHHRCQIEPCHLVEADPMWGLFDENHFIELKGTYTAQSHHAIPHSKRAGTRRLSTLIGVLKDKIHDSLVCDIAFQMPVENTDQQYHYTIGNFCSQRGRSEIGKSSYLIEGCYLITQWKGDNVYQLENELERFYIRLSQHPKYQYRAAPELFRQLAINQDSISFELLTPVEKRSASRQKSVWTVDL